MRPFGTNKYLKIDEVVTGDIIKFLDEGQEVTSTKFKHPEFTQNGQPHPLAGQFKTQFEIGIELIKTGQHKTLTMNKTSYNTLADSWTPDTADWIGRTAKITILPTPNGGKMIWLQPESI